MALDNAQYPSELDVTSPPFSDPVGQADDQIRTAKRALNQGFPNVAGAVSATDIELSFVTGVTSAIQAQLDLKAPLASPVFTGDITLGAVTINETELSILEGATITTVELNYLSGVTSDLQPQINLKAPLASPAFTGTATFSTATFTGNATAANFIATSDRRLKTKIAPASGLGAVMALCSYSYTINNALSIGLMSDEVKAVAPCLVTTNDNGFEGVNYNGVVALLVDCVKTLTARIAALEGKECL